MVHFTVSVGLVHLRGRAADIYLTRPHCASGNMYHYSSYFREFDEPTFLLLIVNNNIVIVNNFYNRNTGLLFDFTKN